MSEAELHFLAGRLQGANRAAAERGELRVTLPVGLVYDDEGATVVDPDDEVQAAVADLFAAFRTGGSAYQVVAAFKGRRFPLRAYGGVWAGQLRWGRLTHSRVLGVLANPAYAGTYVFGRYHSRRVVSPDATVHTKIVELAMDDWPVVIHDHHPGYISWDDFMANRARLAANRTNAGARPPREGFALCQGIISCGSCGRPMTTRYHRSGSAAYECSASKADHTQTPTCRSISASTVDDAVTERLLDALNPQEVALALAAADEVADRRSRRSRSAELAVERARYEAERAERAFHACEPENRMVARSLESRWEARLVALAEADKTLAETQAAAPPLPTKAELEALTADMAGLWHARSTAPRDRKRLLRTLIADITLLPEPDLSKARIGIRWHTGATDELVVARLPAVTDWRRADPAAVKVVRDLGPTHSNADLAGILNEQGYTTGAGRPYDRMAVTNLRYSHHIAPAGLLRDGEDTVAGAAARLKVSTTTVYDWIHKGFLAVRHGLNGRLCVAFGPETERECRERMAASVHIAPSDDPTPVRLDECSVNQAAKVLGISTNVVYYWLETGQLDARKRPDGRG